MKLLIASNNQGKVRELIRLAGLDGLQVITPLEAGFPTQFDIDETGTTFAENAALKASGYALESGLYAIGDDSGLEVEALNGEPGIYTKRYAGENKTDEERISFLLNKMKDVPLEKRKARFVAALAIARPDGSILDQKIGYCPGSIAFTPRGTNGFGYDPVFIVGTGPHTMGEIDELDKDRVSHRGIAIRLLHSSFKSLANL